MMAFEQSPEQSPARPGALQEDTQPEEHLHEMANLDPEDTGLSRGYIYMSSREGRHGPRVKYYRGKPGPSAPSASLSISDNPRVLVDGIQVTARELRELSAFVKLNKTLLLQFWNDHNSILSMKKFLLQFKRIR